MFPTAIRRAAALSVVLFACLAEAQVTFDAAITASGEETVSYNKRSVTGTFPYFEVRGSLFNQTPSRTESVTTCVPQADLNVCQIDKSFGPGYTITIDSINSPGAAAQETYTFTEATGCLKSTVTVTAKRRQRGWYEGRHAIHLACPVKGPWSNTQLKTGLVATTTYDHVATYTGQIGSANGIAGTATVYPNDNGYKVVLSNRNPANALLTAGMFGVAGPGGANGPRLFVLYDANDITARALEVSQGVQNIYNDMPLVAGRRTMARFYVQSKHPATGTQAQLRAFRNNAELPGSPLAPESTIAVRSTGIDRTKLDHAFLFKLPQAWTGAGYVQLQARVNPNGVDEVATGDNTQTELVHFQIADDTINTVVPQPLHLHPNGDEDEPLRIYESDHPTFNAIAWNVLRMHPIAGFIEVDCGLSPLQPAYHGFPLNREWDSTDDDDWDRMLNRVSWKRFWSGCGFTSSYWAGMVHPDLPNPANGGKAFRPGRASVNVMYPFTDWSRPWYHAGSVLAHEIGHNKNLLHECKLNNPAGQDEDYPYPDPCLMSLGNTAFFGNGHDGYFMLDVYHDLWGAPAPSILGSNAPNVAFLSTEQTYPMMSYGSTRWISPYSYCKLLDREGISCNRLLISARYRDPQQQLAAKDSSQRMLGDRLSPEEPRTMSAVPRRVRTSALNLLPRGYVVPEITASAAAYLVVDGVFDLDTGSITEFTLTRVSEVPSANALAESQEQRNETASTLARGADPLPEAIVLWQYDDAASRRPLRIDIVARPQMDGDYRAWQFLQLVELAPGARYFELSVGASVVRQVTPSATAPVVVLDSLATAQLTAGAVLKWTGSDADGDVLTYSIFYSADGGATWNLFAGPIGREHYALSESVPPGTDPLRYFAGTNAGMFRVMAYDGFHTGTDDLAPMFSVPGHPPRVRIAQPDGYRVEYGRTLYLTGDVSDREDGPIPPLLERTSAAIRGAVLTTPALQWSSSIDGPLGSGPEIATRTLSKGVHRITLAAADSDGNTSSAQITVYVGESDVPFRNIAPLATASASSSYCPNRLDAIHCYSPARAIDGDRSTFLGGRTSWSNDTVAGPHALLLTWPTYVKLDQVVVYSSDGYPIREYDLQSWDGTQWVTLVIVRGNTQVERVHTFAAVTTTQLRIVGHAGPPLQPKHVRINEVLVYGTVVEGDATGGRG